MKPAYRVLANSIDITAKIADRAGSIEITDRAGVKSDQCTISIDDRDELLEIPKRGARLEIFTGYVGGQMVRRGAFFVDEVEIDGPLRTMTIRANAVNMNGGIKGPKERSFDDITFGDLVNTIAGDNDLTPSIPEGLASRQLGHIDQTESDMQLLSRICADNGATFKVADGRLVIAAHASGKTASGKSMPAVVLQAKDCESWNATIAERGKYKSVTAYWHNLETGEREEVKVGDGDPSITLKNTYQDENTAKLAADSKLNALTRGTGTVTISGYIGDPTLMAECHAVLVGFRKGIDGERWVINSVTHSISESGYTNSIELEEKI